MLGNRRGIERRATYQLEKPFDPLLMQKYFRSIEEEVYEWDDHKQEDKLSDLDIQRIEDALSVLTEKGVYLMSRGHCLSYSQITNYLCISRGAVQKMIERTDRKITERKTESIFFLCV
jgi:positive control factor